jgi:hypothetical protein
MKLLRFGIHTDLGHLNDMLAKHSMPPVTRHSLPEMGYMAWHNGTPIGAVFLRRCEGETGIVDSLISNPDASPELRHVALDALINHIVEQASKHKVKFLLGYTRDESTLLRSIRLGFEKSPYQVVVKNLVKTES